MSDERPWEDYQNPTKPGDEERPWETYQDPAAAPAAAPAQVGYAEDIAKGSVGGLGRGVAGTLGGGGTIGNVVRYGLTKAGVPEEYIDAGAKAARYVPVVKQFTGPDASQVQSAIENYTGKFYEPKTTPGQYASTVAEFAPGALFGGRGILPKVVNTLIPALTSETAGQITKGTPLEPYARGVTALAAGPLAGKIITPAGPARPAYQAAVDVLEREGIPLTAGQRTGSKAIQWAEANAADMPGSARRAAELNANTANAYDRAMTERLYDRRELTARGVPPDVNLPDPRVARAGPQSLGDTYDRINANDFISNPQLHNRMTGAVNEYERLVLPQNRNANVEQTRNAIVDRLVAGQGRMAGDEYQAIRSQIGDAERAAGNSREQAAFRELKAAMDQAMLRGLPPQDQAALLLNNRRYALQKQLEPAVAAAGENLSPQRVAQTVRAGRAANAAQQRGDFDELAKAAALVMKPLPNSGTAARLGMQQLFHLLPPVLAGGTGATAGGLLGGPAGALFGGLAPFAVSRAVVSGPGQAYLGNRLLPQNARDIVTQALAQQAISQPDVIERNRRERQSYDEQRRRQRTQQGYPE